MTPRRWRWALAIGLFVLIAGCGRATLAVTSSQSRSTPSASSGDASAAAVYSANYCQRLDDGKWVTNDSAVSTTPCVPDPADLTGDADADASVALPRCMTCTMTELKKAERRRPARSASSTSTSPDDTSLARSELATNCAARGVATARQCGCIADHLATVMSYNQIQDVSGDDPRLQDARQAALESCLPSPN